MASVAGSSSSTLRVNGPKQQGLGAQIPFMI